MQFAVESWAPEYGFGADESQLDVASGDVDPSIESPLSGWLPVMPAPLRDPPARILFVDGVRRIDARVWITDGRLARSGVCATVAAGSVLCVPGSATVNEVVVLRGLFAGPAAPAESIDTVHGRYQFVPCAGDAPEDLYLGIHSEMTALEATVAAEHDADLVVFDGPLRDRSDSLGIGYVKTQHVQYLPDDLQPVLGDLAVGERTPLFHISGQGSGRFSWYLRLPGPRSQPLAGIVRCEMAAGGPVADAIERADLVSATLPRFASEPFKDPRAPQNLYPIAGLEQRLRHRLGDALVLERALRRAASNQGGNRS